MSFKRIMALVLCVVCLIGVFAGCSKKEEDEGYVNTSGRDNAAGRAVYDGDEVVMTINGEDVTWNRFFDMVCYAVSDYETTYGPITDFAEGTATGTMSDVIKDDAEYYLSIFAAAEKNMADQNVSYPEDMDKQIADVWNSDITQHGTEEDLIAFVNDYYGSRENYEYIIKTNILHNLLFNAMYGESGSKVTDSEIEENAQDYIQAKHILIETVDENGNPLDEISKVTKMAEAQSILKDLKSYKGDDLQGYFEELMEKHNEDDGAQYYPKGYLFTDGDMVSGFYEAAKALKPGELSDIVETEYGYHIILRLPLNRDSIPINYARYGVSYTLDYIVANRLFSEDFTRWSGENEIVHTPFYDTIDLAKVFPKAETDK